MTGFHLFWRTAPAAGKLASTIPGASASFNRGANDVLSTLPLALCVREISLRAMTPAEWDDAMLSAGGGMRSAHAHLASLRAKHPWPGQVRVFRIAISGIPDSLVGWFTIKREGGVRYFYDGLLVLTDYAHHWAEALDAALAHCGHGRYRYGWQWSLEPCREAALREAPGVQIIAKTEIVVQAVDFARWPDWESYYASLSQNSRRNAKKLAANMADAAVIIRRGFACLLDVPRLVRLRQAMYRRKAISFNAPRTVLAGIINALLCPAQTVIASIRINGAVRSTMRLVEFGDLTYYLDGAATKGGDGAAWFLTIELLRRAFARHPTGKFLMGFYIVGTELAEGLIRMRQSVRVTESRTSIISFEWRAPIEVTSAEGDGSSS